MSGLFQKTILALLMLVWMGLWLFQLAFMTAESLAVIGVLVIMFVAPRSGAGVRAQVAAWCHGLARRKVLSIAIVGMVPLVARLALLPILPIPAPRVHDEFSYLLAADTFAKGRLTNPTHPLWEYFEAPHVNQKPTYSSKYPPAQGLAMGVGQVVFGDPWFGVWLSVGLMCGAVCWMLQGWLPPGWALFGGLLLALQVGVTSYWMNSYWGGAVAAIGGALVFGSYPRLLRRPSVWHAILLAAGLLLLANSRPFEGLIASVALAIFLVRHFIRWDAGRRSLLVRSTIAPALLTLAGGFLVMGYYNWSVTGNTLKLPYQVNRETYGVAPQIFVADQLGPEPTFRQASVRSYYAEWEVSMFEETQTWRGLLTRRTRQIIRLWNLFGGPALSLPLLLLPVALRSRRLRPLAASCGALIFCLLFVIWVMPHYLAPILAPAWALMVQATRHLYHWQEGNKPTGRFYVHLMPVVSLLSVGWCVVQAGVVGDCVQPFPEMSPCVCEADNPMGQRERIESHLRSLGGKHVVLVRYQSEHHVDHEWVYNRADIDNAPVVWAHEMGDEEDRALREYFSDRQVWVVSADEEPRSILPYEPRGASR